MKAKKFLKNMKKFGRVLKNFFLKINSSGKIEYEKDLKKIKLNSDDNLPLNKILRFHNKDITIRCVLSEDGKFYSQLFSDHVLYQL